MQYKKESRDKGKAAEKDNKNTKYSGDPKRRYDKVNKLFTCIEFSQDGSELIVGQCNGIITILRVSDGKFKTLVQPLKVSDTEAEYYIKQLIVSPDGPYFAT